MHKEKRSAKRLWSVQQGRDIGWVAGRLRRISPLFCASADEPAWRGTFGRQLTRRLERVRQRREGRYDLVAVAVHSRRCLIGGRQRMDQELGQRLEDAFARDAILASLLVALHVFHPCRTSRIIVTLRASLTIPRILVGHSLILRADDHIRVGRTPSVADG